MRLTVQFYQDLSLDDDWHNFSLHVALLQRRDVFISKFTIKQRNAHRIHCCHLFGLSGMVSYVIARSLHIPPSSLVLWVRSSVFHLLTWCHWRGDVI
jgi:hypothetical protein